MEATIKVIVGLTDSLEKLATEALQLWRMGKEPQKPPKVQGVKRIKTLTEEEPKKTEPQPEEPKKTEPKPEPKPEPKIEPEPEPLDLENVEPAPLPQPEEVTPTELPPNSAPADAVPVPPPDDETLRTLLDICITRWAGQGSENSKDPKVLLKRKDVCNCFKEIARHLGAEKPTKLQGDARLTFIHAIENQLAQEGDRITWLPF